VDSTDVQVMVNGVEAQVSNRTFTAFNVPLSPGANVISALATDVAGNMSSASIQVTRNDSLSESLTLVSGNNQADIVGNVLAEPLVVAFRAQDGSPLANREVVFRVVEGDGALTSESRPSATRSLVEMTDSDGLVFADFQLGTRSGSGLHKVRVSSLGVPTQVLFSASALPQPPDKVVIVGGNNQMGQVQQALKFPLIVIVSDKDHNPIEGVDLTFRVTRGNGTFSNGQDEMIVQSDKDGRAVVQYRLGRRPGFNLHEVEVTFPGQLTLPAVFTASAFEAGPPDQTTVAGVVLDNSNNPVPGVTVSVEGFTPAVITYAQGQFELGFPDGPIPQGAQLIVVDGETVPGTFYPELHLPITIVPGVRNVWWSPFYLVPLDPSKAKLVGPLQGATFTLDHVPGFSLTILPGTARFPDGTDSGFVQVDAVHGDKVPMPPPNGMQWRFVITIQPALMTLTKPAPFTLPNLQGLAPGAKAELYSFDHDLGMFVSVGTGTVSEDGSIIESDPGFGIIKGGWHGGGDPSPPGGAGGGGGGY
jgi:hypothetical protein